MSKCNIVNSQKSLSILSLRLSNLLFILFSYSRYIFDRVFNTDEDNSKVYQDLGFDIIEAAVSGFNSTIFAYGQTASGKTHTMMGDDQQKGTHFLNEFCNRRLLFFISICNLEF